MNDKEFITSIRDQCNAQLGGGSGPGPTPVPKPDANSVTTIPNIVGDLGVGNGPAVINPVQANVPFGMRFTIQAGSKNDRKIHWEGHPGQFWSHNSWAIFDSGGQRTELFADNVVVVGTLGYTIDNEVLKKLGAGTYTVGVCCNAAGTMATFFQQS